MLNLGNLILQYDQRIDQAIGALASATAILLGTKIDASRENGFKIFKAKINLTYRAKTVDEGPLMWGLCCNVADAAAIKGILEDDEQSSFGDPEIGGGEWLKILGYIPRGATASDLERAEEMIGTKINWVIPEGSKMNVFVFNMDDAAITTGTLLDYSINWSGVWLRD